jgi:hypothetical protein
MSDHVAISQPVWDRVARATRYVETCTKTTPTHGGSLLGLPPVGLWAQITDVDTEKTPTQYSWKALDDKQKQNTAWGSGSKDDDQGYAIEISGTPIPKGATVFLRPQITKPYMICSYTAPFSYGKAQASWARYNPSGSDQHPGYVELHAVDQKGTEISVKDPDTGDDGPVVIRCYVSAKCLQQQIDIDAGGGDEDESTDTLLDAAPDWSPIVNGDIVAYLDTGLTQKSITGNDEDPTDHYALLAPGQSMGGYYQIDPEAPGGQPNDNRSPLGWVVKAGDPNTDYTSGGSQSFVTTTSRDNWTKGGIYQTCGLYEVSDTYTKPPSGSTTIAPMHNLMLTVQGMGVDSEGKLRQLDNHPLQICQASESGYTAVASLYPTMCFAMDTNSAGWGIYSSRLAHGSQVGANFKALNMPQPIVFNQSQAKVGTMFVWARSDHTHFFDGNFKGDEHWIDLTQQTVNDPNGLKDGNGNPVQQIKISISHIGPSDYFGTQTFTPLENGTFDSSTGVITLSSNTATEDMKGHFMEEQADTDTTIDLSSVLSTLITDIQLSSDGSQVQVKYWTAGGGGSWVNKIACTNSCPSPTGGS